MNIPRFELEHYLSTHEHSARIVLGTSGIATLPRAELPPGGPADPGLDYGDVPGDHQLISAISDRRGVPEENVLVTVGGSEALFLAPFAFVGPGDRVLVERPAYFPLVAVPHALGARVERFDRTFDDDWRVDVDDLISRIDGDVSMVSLANPNNPTGRLVPQKDIIRLADACAEVDAVLLVDDTFAGLVSPRPRPSALLHPSIVSIDTLTKCQGLSGLRVGWLVAEPGLRSELRDAKALTTIVNPAGAQRLAAHALHHEDVLLARSLRITHDNLVRWRAFKREHTDLGWREPDAPLVSALRLPAGMDDVKFCEGLLRETGVLLVPGTYLDMPGFVRLGLGQRPELFRAGLEALDGFLRAY